MWYGIVDWNYFHQEIDLLMDTDHAWSSFSGTVAVVRSVLPMGQYLQLATVQNKRHFTQFYFDFTIADILFILRMKYDRLALNGEKITAGRFAQAYDGNNKYSQASIMQRAKNAMRHPNLVIDTLREIQ